jgi:hypothetical protein
VHLSFRQALDSCRIGAIASTLFIGPGENNFSHKKKRCFCSCLSRLESYCLASIQSLIRSDALAVPLHFTQLYRFATETEARYPLRTHAPAPNKVFAQKTAARESSPAAIGLSCNRICFLD